MENTEGMIKWLEQQTLIKNSKNAILTALSLCTEYQRRAQENFDRCEELPLLITTSGVCRGYADSESRKLRSAE